MYMCKNAQILSVYVRMSLFTLSIEIYVRVYYNIIKIRVRQTNNPKSCEVGNHIPVRSSQEERNNSQEDDPAGCLTKNIGGKNGKLY